MKAKCLAVTVSVLMFLGIASAEQYHIRVSFNTNLRFTYSLEGRITEMAPAGTVLHVIGANERWLRIRRSGSEVWMASWVPYTRVEGAGARSDIDNCCFVNRQCRAEQEWIDGYWAYQRHECAVSQQEQLADTGQSVEATPADIDNCCFVDRHCRTDEEWVNGYWAYQNNQCSGSASSTAVDASVPFIEGSEVFVRQIQSALNVLRREAPDSYEYVISAMDKVFEVPSPLDNPALCRGGAYANSRDVSATTGCTFSHTTCRSQRLSWIGLLAHEACHIHTAEAGIDYAAMGLNEEKECALPARAATDAVDPAFASRVIIYDLNATRVSLGQSIIVPTWC